MSALAAAGLAPPPQVGNAIDPATGRPYQFSPNGSTGENVYTPNGTNLSGADPTTGLGGYSGTDGGGENISDITHYGFNQPDWLKSIGYAGGPTQAPSGSGENFQGLDSTGNLESYLKQQGITLAEKGGESNGQNRVFQAFKNGQPIGSSIKVGDNEDAFLGAMMVAASVAGGAAAGAGAAGGGAGAEGLSGMDLAADAAAGTGNNIVTAGSALGGGEGSAVSGLEAFEQPSAIAGDSAGPSGTDAANFGSDAHFYQPGGPQLGGINASTAGTGLQVSNAYDAAHGLGGSPLTTLKNIATNPATSKLLGPALSALSGAGSGSSTPSTTLNAGSPPTSGYLAEGAHPYNYQGFTATNPGSRPGHTRGPSMAVNLNDPSASMFGYGATPLYYPQGADPAPLPQTLPVPAPGHANTLPVMGAPMAEGGSVDDTSYDPSYDATLTQAYTPGSYTDPYAKMFGTPSVPLDTKGPYSDPYDDLPAKDEGPMAWLTRLLDGSKGSNKNILLGVGGLGLLSSLLGSKTPRGYQSPQQLQASVVGSQNSVAPGLAAKFNSYFARAPGTYQAPQSPFKPAQSKADGGAVQELLGASMPMGGRREPVVGTRSPLPGSGGGPLSKEAIIRALVAANAASSAQRPLPPQMRMVPRMLEQQESDAGMADGGGVGGPAPSGFTDETHAAMMGNTGFAPEPHTSYLRGPGGGQDDIVPIHAAPGEYVWDADTVAALGDGSNEHGARLLDRTREQIRAHKRGAPATSIPPKALSPLEYMRRAS